MDDYRDVEEEIHNRLVRALRVIAKGQLKKDYNDFAVTAGRMQAIAREALTKGPYPVGF